MGDVIQFRPLASGVRQGRNAAATIGECRILFFTGVRYERHAELEADAPPPGPRASTKPRVSPKRGKKRA